MNLVFFFLFSLLHGLLFHPPQTFSSSRASDKNSPKKTSRNKNPSNQSSSKTKNGVKSSRDSCQTLLNSKPNFISDSFGHPLSQNRYLIIPDGPAQDNNLIPKYRDFLEKMTEKDGVLDQLGIPRTQQIVEFLRPQDLNALIATPLPQPVAHFWDGALLNQSLQNPGTVFEVVYPGPSYNHGFYRDDTNFDLQISVIAHVAGHNHFAVSSFFPHYRSHHPVQKATDFSKTIQVAYGQNPKEEVENYYLFLQTLARLTDHYSAFYREPKDFHLDPDVAGSKNFPDRETQMKTQSILSRGLKSPTENVFNAVVGRIQQSNAPQWKKDLATLMTESKNWQPVIVHTQNMNEGWASLMQQIVIKHMGEEYNTLKHWFSTSTGPASSPYLQIGNPYWLGLRVWKRFMEKFMKRPEVQSLEGEMAKDRAFIQYATEEIIGQMDDFQFLEKGLDDYMIQGLDLALIRKAKHHELKNLPPPPHGMPNPQPVIIVSKDPKRVKKAIIHQAVSVKMGYRPRVVLSSFNRQGTGELELSINDDVGRSLPVDSKTIAPALYSLSRLMEGGQPVSFEATFIDIDKKISNSPLKTQLNPTPISPNSNFLRLRLVVQSQGNLRVFRVVDENKPREVEILPDDPIYKELEAPLHEYIRELYFEDEAVLESFEAHNSRFQGLFMQAFNQRVNNLPITSLVEHVPSAADAISEFQNKVNLRMLIALERAMRGKGGLKNTSQGLFLKALPSPKEIQFDDEYINFLIATSETGDLDLALTQKNDSKNRLIKIENVFNGDKMGEIRPTEGAPGHGGWVPGPPPEGRGSSQPGDQPGDPGGLLPGEEALDPSWVPVPKDLYAQFLGERIQLPNLQHKKGALRSKKMRLRGIQRQKKGQIIMDKTAFNALRKGVGLEVVQGNGDDLGSNLSETLDRGLVFMQPRDFVVRKLKPVPKPDSNAVVVFAMDASGSTDPYMGLYKRFVYDMKALIEFNYTHAQFEYIIFDTKAYHLDSEKAFFTSRLGGGTSYSVALKKVMEVMEEK